MSVYVYVCTGHVSFSLIIVVFFRFFVSLHSVLRIFFRFFFIYVSSQTFLGNLLNVIFRLLVSEEQSNNRQCTGVQTGRGCVGSVS